MESGFISEMNPGSEMEWEPIRHRGSGRFEFFKVRLFGAMHFVKRPTTRYAHDLQTTESLRKEFNVGYNLSHPYIVKYLRMEDGAVYEEYVDGLSLQQMIEQNDLRLKSPQFLERMCRQLLEATAYLHSHGVVHNDIKPENVMITRIGDHVKLVDLGAAYSDMWDSTPGYTPSYKAPEQGTELTNIYTDIFLIGKLMEELSAYAGIKSQWEDFIKRATCKVPKFRFSTDEDAMREIPPSRIKELIKLIIFIILFFSIFGVFNYVTSDFNRWLFSHVLSLFGINI